MVKITKVTTKKGDTGKSKISGKGSLSKRSLKIHALGDIDELNSFLGFALLAFENNFPIIQQQIERIQQELFNLGAMIAAMSSTKREHASLSCQRKLSSTTSVITSNDIERLEIEIGKVNKNLTPLSSFILPGGNEMTARLHLARTVCRRAERSVVALDEQEKLEKTIIPYLNRLSDWLFVHARYIIKECGLKETLWKKTT